MSDGREQLFEEVRELLARGLSVPLQRAATLKFRPGHGRRLEACLWDSLDDATANADQDEIVVKVSVRVERLYRTSEPRT
jgi:hypothetical protein